MTPSTLQMTVVLAAAMVSACGEPDPPTITSFEVWEGYITDTNTPVLEKRVEQQETGTFTLRRDTEYVGRLVVHTSGRADRCLFRPVGCSWLPSREYSCYPETVDGQMNIDIGFATWTFNIERYSEYYLFVQLDEHDANREQVRLYETRKYAVDFLEE